MIGIAVESAAADRTARVLEAWAAAEPGTPDQGLTVKQEIKAIHEAMVGEDEEFLARYGRALPGRRKLFRPYLGTALIDASKTARDLAEASISGNTRRAY